MKCEMILAIRLRECETVSHKIEARISHRCEFRGTLPVAQKRIWNSGTHGFERLNSFAPSLRALLLQCTPNQCDPFSRAMCRSYCRSQEQPSSSGSWSCGCSEPARCSPTRATVH